MCADYGQRSCINTLGNNNIHSRILRQQNQQVIEDWRGIGMNAREEFLEHIKDRPRVVCAVVEEERDWRTMDSIATLYEGYNTKEWETFLEALGSHDYDEGYGGQNLFGNIWYEDGTYSDRGEYDGSEWWEYHKAPPKPTQTK